MVRNLALAICSLALFFGMLEGTLALVGVEPALATRDPFVGFASQIPLFQAEDAESPDALVTAPGRRMHFNIQRFDRSKPEGTFRIFCLGGSTTYGRPYGDGTSFCGWLRGLLSRVDTSRRWEVINAGGISYASYRIANLIDELVGYQPDLFVLYTGHNEFLERRTYPDLLDAPEWLIALRVRLNRTRTYSWLTESIATARGQTVEATLGDEVLPEEVDAILDQSAGFAYYTRADLQREAARVHFRFNLERILATARAADAGVVMVRPASNLRDSSPFKSEHTAELAADRRSEARALLRRSQDLLVERRPAEALVAVDEAIALDPGFAHAHFLRGRALLGLGRNAESGVAFTRARDEDIVPLRTLSDFGEEVARVASDAEIPLVDFEALSANRATAGIPGADLFLDHVHPTIAAHGLLAVALVDAMIDAGIVRPDALSPEEAMREVQVAVVAGVDRRSHGLAQKNLAKVLAWAGKYEEAYRAALRGIELVGGWHWEVHAVASRSAVQLRKSEAALAHTQDAVRLAPKNAVERYRLGEILAALGRTAEAAEQFETAAKLRPKMIDAHLAAGRLLVEVGRTEDGLRHLRTALVLARKSGDPALVERVQAVLEAVRNSPAPGPAPAPGGR
jgi:tetratricopeptide (TPR) repeat protein